MFSVSVTKNREKKIGMGGGGFDRCQHLSSDSNRKNPIDRYCLSDIFTVLFPLERY